MSAPKLIALPQVGVGVVIVRERKGVSVGVRAGSSALRRSGRFNYDFTERQPA